MYQQPIFPTRIHASVAALVPAFFAGRTGIDTVLMVNSCARGQASPESDLDFAILANPSLTDVDIMELELGWRIFSALYWPFITHLSVLFYWF